MNEDAEMDFMPEDRSDECIPYGSLARAPALESFDGSRFNVDGDHVFKSRCSHCISFL